MLQGSFLSTLQLFDDDPRIVTAINHRPVKTLADVRTALSKPVVRKGRKYVHVVTADDETVVLPVDVVESEEARRRTGNVRGCCASRGQATVRRGRRIRI